jgi:AraC-like DNA-binding protein
MKATPIPYYTEINDFWASMSAMIHERIVAEAKTQILHTQDDIAEIAFRHQFSDPANFNQFFK